MASIDLITIRESIIVCPVLISLADKDNMKGRAASIDQAKKTKFTYFYFSGTVRCEDKLEARVIYRLMRICSD